MKIGIDIDDVIIDFCTPFVQFHNKEYKTDWVKTNIDLPNIEELTGETWDQMQIKMDRFV